MRVPARFDVGVCTHTGLIRTHNDDDYLLAALPIGLLAAVADGMGGVAGGAEASRTALRALATALAAPAGGDLEERLDRGVAAAGVAVHQASLAMPALRGMGTTLTALCFGPEMAAGVHVGDTRLYRLRGGQLTQLTTDHVAGGHDNLLTRCVGGGRAAVEADRLGCDLQAGDRFALVTDGISAVLPAEQLERLLRGGPAQQVAQALVQRALDTGGSDNCTALVVDLLHDSSHRARDLPLPRDEHPLTRARWPRPVPLRTPIWPWLVILAAVAVTARALLVWLGVEVDGWLSGCWLPRS